MLVKNVRPKLVGRERGRERGREGERDRERGGKREREREREREISHQFTEQRLDEEPEDVTPLCHHIKHAAILVRERVDVAQDGSVVPAKRKGERIYFPVIKPKQPKRSS